MPKIGLISKFFVLLFFSLFFNLLNAQEIGYETFITRDYDTVKTFYLHGESGSIGYLDKNNQVSKMKIARDSDDLFDYESLFFHMDTALHIMTHPHESGTIYALVILDEKANLFAHGTTYYCPVEFRQKITEKLLSLD